MDFGVVILAIIQGISEFLPISSSAHLILFRDLFGIGASSVTGNLALTFDIALHFGTLLAICLYFFKDFWNMIVKGLTKGVKDQEGKLLWYLIIATIPAAIVGVLLEEKIENVIRSNFIIIACALIIMGIVIYFADRYNKDEKTVADIQLKDAFLIGCSQVFALVPGFSRSGTTIAAARCLKIKKEDAAKFSFFLSAPVIFGAVVLNLLKKETIGLIITNFNVFVIGVLVSFIAGLLCIEFLLKYLKKHDFKIFMIYRVLLGILVILYTVWR